jgi:hypothetical protein
MSGIDILPDCGFAYCCVCFSPLYFNSLLIATHQRYDQAWNAGDLNTVFEIWQDGGIWIPTMYGFPMVTNSAVGMQMFAQWLETHVFRYSWYKVDYWVIGDTGLVWRCLHEIS